MSFTAGASTQAPRLGDQQRTGTSGRSSRRRVQGGPASTDLIFSARVASNASVFADLLRLHVPLGAVIAEVTYGRGAFWGEVPADAYRLLTSDLQSAVDCTSLPYRGGTVDALVLDPPYMEGLFRRDQGQLAGGGSHAPFRARYSAGAATEGGPKYHAAVLDLYRRAGVEAHRVLRRGGVFIVKCQDEVSAGRQRLTHIELVNEFADRFSAKDLFVVVRAQRPGVSRIKRHLLPRLDRAMRSHSMVRGVAALGGVGRLWFRLGGRLRLRQGSRLRFPAVFGLVGRFRCSCAGFVGGCSGDISMSAGERAVSRLPMADRVPVVSAARRCPLVTCMGAVMLACRVVASRRRCFATLAWLVVPAVVFAVLWCVAGRGRGVQPSLSGVARSRAAGRAGGAL